MVVVVARKKESSKGKLGFNPTNKRGDAGQPFRRHRHSDLRPCLRVYIIDHALLQQGKTHGILKLKK